MNPTCASNRTPHPFTMHRDAHHALLHSGIQPLDTIPSYVQPYQLPAEADCDTTCICRRADSHRATSGFRAVVGSTICTSDSHRLCHVETARSTSLLLKVCQQKKSGIKNHEY